MKHYQKLKTIFKRLSHLDYIHRIMMWDEAVMMPEGAGESRAQALATLSRTRQQMLISEKTKTFIDKAKEEGDLPPWDSANLAWMEKKYINAADISPKLTEQMSQTSLICEQAWRKYRPKNNWQDFVPFLEQSFELVKEIADRRSQTSGIDPYDLLLDDYAPGFTRQRIDSIFSELKQTLPALAQKSMEKHSSDSILIPKGPFPIEKQKMLGLEVMKALRFDFNHGRLDVSHHPFCSGGPRDVRMTTRYSEQDLLPALFGICHETGHALYEQGLPLEWIDQPVGKVESMAMHESQSLLIEMQVCRSRAFLHFLLPLIQKIFPDQRAFTVDNLYKIITQVKPGLIRVDADEVSYPLHIILRYEIEKGLFKGEITIRDLPVYWDEYMKKYLNISTRENDKDGVMQDVHWPSGAFGYFPAYTLGRMIASQFFSAFAKSHPTCQEDIKRGNFLPLRNWLKDKIHSQASALSTDDLLLKVTGKKLYPGYFIQHVETVYG